MAKKSVNISMDSDLLQLAKALNVNISQASMQGVEATVKQRQEADWQAENATAIAAENEFTRKNGVFAAGGKPW
jgi:antitoxin CcdA